MSDCKDSHIYEPQSAKDIPQVFSKDEGFCESREDNLHCVCWWEEKPCCACGYDPPHVHEGGCGCEDNREKE